MSTIPNIQDLIRSYSEFRGLVEPGELESLLFFVSEVGELVEAYAEAHKDELDEPVWILLYDMHNVGLRADDAVTRMNPYWIRNHDRHKAPDISSEIGDCRMMLEKFSRNFGKGEDSEIHLRRKMQKKGFSGVFLVNIFPQIQGRLTTRTFNHIFSSFTDTGNITVEEIVKTWLAQGKIPQLHLGKTGSKQLIDALIVGGYYLPGQEKNITG